MHACVRHIIFTEEKGSTVFKDLEWYGEITECLASCTFSVYFRIRHLKAKLLKNETQMSETRDSKQQTEIS